MSDTDPTAETSKPAAALREAGVRAREGIEQARRKSRDVITATREKGEAVIEETRDKTLRAAAETNRLFQEHPVAAVAAAAAAGAVLAIFVPRLNITGRAAKLAGRAAKAAVTGQASQRLWSAVSGTGRAASTSAETDDEA